MSAAPELRSATRAVAIVFAGAGFAFASWASRIPQVRDHLGLDPGQLGLLLLSLAVGSLLALPLAGMVVSRAGERATVTVLALVASVGLALIAIGQSGDGGLSGPGSLAALVPFGLFVTGFGFGMWDVAMNVHGTVVERHLGRTILPRFHAAFSIGTVTGAGVGAGAVALGIPVTAHLLAVAALIAIAVPAAARRFLPEEPSVAADADGGSGAGSGSLAAWREPRTLLIGLFVLCMAFSEGTGNDWLSVAVIDGYDTADAVGTLTFAVFLVAMTTGRWFGPAIIDRHGRVPVLRACAALAATGLALVTFGSVLALALLGAALWGLGTAVGFPVGMSAAADDPAHAAARVSVVSSIGYVAFLAGPPVIGFLADHVGTLHSLAIAAALLALAAVISPVAAPLAGDEPRGEPQPPGSAGGVQAGQRGVPTSAPRS